MFVRSAIFETPFGDHGAIDDARFLGRIPPGNVAVNAHRRLAGLESSLAVLVSRLVTSLQFLKLRGGPI